MSSNTEKAFDARIARAQLQVQDAERDLARREKDLASSRSFYGEFSMVAHTQARDLNLARQALERARAQLAAEQQAKQNYRDGK